MPKSKQGDKPRVPGISDYPVLSPPRGRRAIEDSRTRWGLWGRARTCLRRLGLFLGGGAVAVTLIVVGIETSAEWVTVVGAIAFPISLMTVPFVLGDLAGLVNVVRMWRLLARHPWRMHKCRAMFMGEGAIGVVRMTLWDAHHSTEHHVIFQASRRRETLRGLARGEVWVAGDPAGTAVLVAAGGGEMFVVRRNRQWERVVARRARLAAKPSKPSKPRRVNPKAQARAAGLAKKRTAAYQRYQDRELARRTRGPLLPWRKQRIFGPDGGIGGSSKRKSR